MTHPPEDLHNRVHQDNFMAEENHPGSLAYPKKRSLNRLIYKLPLLLWRLGFGPYLSHPNRGGKRMLVLTTRGRKSKLPRHTMMSCINFDQKNYAISGWWLRSDWIKNIHEDPLVTVQIGFKIYAANARKVVDLEEFRGVAQSLFDSGGDSHFKEWLDTLEITNTIDDFIDKRDLVHFIGFDPVELEGPAPLTANLIWVWAVFISFMLGLFFFLWK